jgi:PKD repeat protein
VQSPSHTYDDHGIYTVSLNVTNACGSNTTTKTNYITVNPKPVANFSATPTSGCAPLTVVFTDLSTGDPTSWSWTFTGGDPASETGAGPHTVIYNSPGIYDVTLTVTNACGSDTETKTGYITAVDCAPEPRRRGAGGGCPEIKECTVDWEGLNTTQTLYNNDRLTADC